MSTNKCSTSQGQLLSLFPFPSGTYNYEIIPLAYANFLKLLFTLKTSQRNKNTVTQFQATIILQIPHAQSACSPRPEVSNLWAVDCTSLQPTRNQATEASKAPSMHAWDPGSIQNHSSLVHGKTAFQSGAEKFWGLCPNLMTPFQRPGGSHV